MIHIAMAANPPEVIPKVNNGMLENIHLKDLYAMEILSLACTLVRAIDSYGTVKSRLTERPTPITDARTSALTVAHLAAIEFLGDDGGGDEDALFEHASALLGALGVETG